MSSVANSFVEFGEWHPGWEPGKEQGHFLQCALIRWTLGKCDPVSLLIQTHECDL